MDDSRKSADLASWTAKPPLAARCRCLAHGERDPRVVRRLIEENPWATLVSNATSIPASAGHTGPVGTEQRITQQE